jgi:hypothetical protein
VQLKTISQWLPTAAAQQAALRNSVSVLSLNYNWNLNEQAGTGVAARRAVSIPVRRISK